MLTTLKEYFLCDADEQISASDSTWLTVFISAVALGSLVGLIGLVG